MFTKRFFLVVMLLSSLIANDLCSKTSPYQFLRYNAGARAAGLAGAFVAMEGDASAVFFNPASIATVDEKPMSFTFLKHVLDINSGNFTYQKHLDGFGTLAGSVIYTNYGSFERADSYGNRSGNFGANDMALAFSYANQLDTNLYWGATIKFIYVNIEKANSIAFAVDAGLLYKLSDGKTNIGLSILNAGSHITKFQDFSENLPLDIRLGFNHRLEGLPLLFNFSFHHLADRTDNFFDKILNFSLGGEIYFGDNIQARLGYDNLIRRYTTPSNDKQFSGFSGGLGYKHNDFCIDFALARVGTNANLFRFGVNLNL